MEEVRDKKLRQVRALLDKASDSGSSPAEAQALREKADDLMLAYTISEFEARQREDKDLRVPPEWRYIEICGPNNVIKTQLIDLMQEVIQHCRCRAFYTGLFDQKSGSKVNAVGFPSDLDWVEVLYISLLVQLSQELEPKVRPDFSYVENLVLLKEAGLKWARVHELLHPEDPNPVTKAQGVRFTKMYTDYCVENSRTRMRTSPQQYQRNYAEGFVSEVTKRFSLIRDHQQQEGLRGSGMELALRDEVKAVFESKSSGTTVQLAGRSKFDYAAQNAGRAAGSRADLGQGRVSRTKELN